MLKDPFAVENQSTASVAQSLLPRKIRLYIYLLTEESKATWNILYVLGLWPQVLRAIRLLCIEFIGIQSQGDHV